MVPDIEENYGAPLAVVHRADLRRVLLDAAIGCGCKILEDHEVLDIDKDFLPVSIEIHLYDGPFDGGSSSD